MSWKPWIAIEADDTEDPDAARLYRETQQPTTGAPSDLMRITSKTPRVARAIHELCAAVYATASGLTPREKEITALVTSASIGCVH